MKKIIYLYAFLFSFSLSAQDLYWYDVFLDVKGENAKAFEEAVNNYYSSIDFPDGVNMTFSSIPLKGQDYKETHILSFVSPTSSGLAEIRGALSGDEWDDYVDIVRPSVESVRAVVGTASMLYNEDQFNPIGQAWCFKVKSKDIPAFSDAYNELMKSFDFPGFVGLAQVSHGISNGENILIYGAFKDLNDAFSFGPKNDKEAKAFAEFFEATAALSCGCWETATRVTSPKGAESIAFFKYF